MNTTRTPSLASRLNDLPIPAAERARYVRELAHAEAFADDIVHLVRDAHELLASLRGWFGRRRPSFAR
jgi:hypothetical protein